MKGEKKKEMVVNKRRVIRVLRRRLVLLSLVGSTEKEKGVDEGG